MGLDAGDEVTRAIETVAIACHCDVGRCDEHGRADLSRRLSVACRRISESRTSGWRLCAELFDATGDEQLIACGACTRADHARCSVG